MITFTEKNYLLNHWEEQSNVFLENLAAIRIKPGKRNIHDLRVAIKKMKSALLLAVHFADEVEKPDFETIRLLFRLTGKYRDVEMSIFLLRKVAKAEKLELPSLSRNLRAMLAITRNIAKREALKDQETELASISNWITRLLFPVSNEILEKKIEEQVAIITNELKKLFEKFSQHAHEIRIQLKQLYYWLKLSDVNPFFDKRQMKILDKVLVALGNWHDYFVLHEKTRRFRKEYLVKNTPEYIHSCKTEEITALLQEQWLTDARLRLEKLEIFG